MKNGTFRGRGWYLRLRSNVNRATSTSDGSHNRHDSEPEWFMATGRTRGSSGRQLVKPERAVDVLGSRSCGVVTAGRGIAVRLIPWQSRGRSKPVGQITVQLETKSIMIDTDDLEWLRHRLASRPPEDETTALEAKLRDILNSPEPRTLALGEAEAGFVLVNLVGHDQLPAGLAALRDGIEEES